jgi:hypothetical protein
VTPPGDEARCGADWWISRLGSHHDPIGMGSGRALTVDDMELLVSLNVATVRGGRFDADERDRFQRELEEGIEALIRAPDDPRRLPEKLRVVQVDWEPDDTLVQAAARAGLDLEVTDLPLKTMMVIEPGVQVRVSQGYGQPWQTIWPSA